MFEEKRKYPRLSMNVRVDWEKKDGKTVKDGGGSGITKNISEGGICLIVYDKVEVGHALRLKIELPTKKTIESVGKIVWVKEFEIVGKPNEMRYDIGIEFSEIEPRDRNEIKSFISALLKNGINSA